MMTEKRTSRLSFMHRYPIVTFYMLALVLGAGTIYLVIQGVLPTSLALLSALSASLAGLIMTAIIDGKAGLKLLLSRLLIWRVGIGYWLFATLFLVPAILIGFLFNPLFNGDPISFSNIKPAFNILPMFIVFFIVAGLGQELGWTGFLILRLQARFGALTACIIRAFLVGIWHLPLLIYATLQPNVLVDFQYGAWIAQKGFLIVFVTIVLMLILPWSIFYTWIFNNTKGSLLLVATLHASEIWLAYWLMSTGVSPDNLDNYWGYGLVLVLTASLIVIITGPRNLSRKQKRIAYEKHEEVHRD
jgi:membrane protease YdiL (CAAX protease family)